MKQFFLVYTCDVHHSHSSKVLIAVAESKSISVNLCMQFAAKESESLSDDDLYNLANINQTQGYEGEATGEFMIEEISTLNELL